MPFPDPILLIALIALLASGVSMWVFNLFSSSSSKIRETHTHFALNQAAERLNEIEDASFPTTTTDLVSVLRASDIDWNSCEVVGDQILDGWGQAMTTTFDASSDTWTFRSSGTDSEVGTADDIEIAATRNQPGEQGGGGQAATRSESK
ncbi:MAG: hypothetical protein HRU46_01995 [Verrucomicrobiales bacterium]|nr:hypothetical protein [Verrucomicrobiales bacterium]